MLGIYSLTPKSAKKFPLLDVKLLPSKELVLSEVRSLDDSTRTILVVQGSTTPTS